MFVVRCCVAGTLCLRRSGIARASLTPGALAWYSSVLLPIHGLSTVRRADLREWYVRRRNSPEASEASHMPYHRQRRLRVRAMTSENDNLRPTNRMSVAAGSRCQRSAYLHAPGTGLRLTRCLTTTVSRDSSQAFARTALPCYSGADAVSRGAGRGLSLRSDAPT